MFLVNQCILSHIPVPVEDTVISRAMLQRGVVPVGTSEPAGIAPALRFCLCRGLTPPWHFSPLPCQPGGLIHRGLGGLLLCST